MARTALLLRASIARPFLLFCCSSGMAWETTREDTNLPVKENPSLKSHLVACELLEGSLLGTADVIPDKDVTGGSVENKHSKRTLA